MALASLHDLLLQQNFFFIHAVISAIICKIIFPYLFYTIICYLKIRIYCGVVHVNSHPRYKLMIPWIYENLLTLVHKQRPWEHDFFLVNTAFAYDKTAKKIQKEVLGNH